MTVTYLGTNAPNFKKPLTLKDLLIEAEEKKSITGPKPWEQQMAAVRQIMQSARK